MAWKLVHGVFKRGKPIAPHNQKNHNLVTKPVTIRKPKQKEILSADEIKKLIDSGNEELKALLLQLLAQKQTVIVSKDSEEIQKSNNGFKAIEIDESIANVIAQEDLEGQVATEEEETEDNTAVKAAKLKALLSKKK